MEVRDATLIGNSTLGRKQKTVWDATLMGNSTPGGAALQRRGPPVHPWDGCRIFFLVNVSGSVSGNFVFLYRPDTNPIPSLYRPIPTLYRPHTDSIPILYRLIPTLYRPYTAPWPTLYQPYTDLYRNLYSRMSAQRSTKTSRYPSLYPPIHFISYVIGSSKIRFRFLWIFIKFEIEFKWRSGEFIYS